MKLCLLGISLLSLFGVVTGAQADTLAATDVSLFGGPVVSDQGPTTSSVTIDSNNFANAVINAAAGTMGVEAVAGPLNTANASASHTDTWACAGGGCDALVSAPISLGVFLDGSATLGASNTAHLQAEYDFGLGEGFKFVFDQADGGFGITAGYFFPGGTLVNVPVALNETTDAQGNPIVTFSVDSPSTRVGMPSTCSATPDHPCPFQAGDLQDFSAFAFGGSVLALHTFGVTVTSLDPSIQLISADGRTGGTSTAPVPEPATLTMMGMALAAIAVLSRRKRQRV